MKIHVVLNMFSIVCVKRLCHVVESNVTQETLSSLLTIHFIHLSESQKE